MSQVPLVSDEDPYDIMVPKPMRYIKHYQNDEPFHVVFTHTYSNAITYTSCTDEFPKWIKMAPYDIVILHEEWYHYPRKDDDGIEKEVIESILLHLHMGWYQFFYGTSWSIL